MSDSSAIQWTDATWNPTSGCTKVSPGCAHCYIERTPPFRIHGRRFERGRIPLQLHADRLEQPLHWRKPRRVFVNSLSDLFHDDVPNEFIAAVFGVMAASPRHTYQVLTKRPDRMRDWFCWLAGVADPEPHTECHAYALAEDESGYIHRHSDGDGRPWPLPNVWLGVSVENQHFADARIPLLLQTPAAVRFISAEPLLGPVDLSGLIAAHFENPADDAALDWVIVGGESGPGARPFDVAWARSILAQCNAAGVPAFVKQFGANVRDRNDAGFDGDYEGTGRAWPEHLAIEDRVEDSPDGWREEYQGAPVRLHLRDSKGGDMAEWPADLRVREFPR